MGLKLSISLYVNTLFKCQIWYHGKNETDILGLINNDLRAESLYSTQTTNYVVKSNMNTFLNKEVCWKCITGEDVY